METTCSCNTNDRTLSENPAYTHSHENTRKCATEPVSSREEISLNPEPSCDDRISHSCPYPGHGDRNFPPAANRSTTNTLSTHKERSSRQYFARQRHSRKTSVGENYYSVVSHSQHHKHSTSPSLSLRFLQLLVTALFIGTFSSLAHATSDKSLHTSTAPSQNAPQQNIQDVFMFGDDDWNVEELDSELRTSFPSTIEPKLHLNLQQSVALVGHLYQSEILLSGHEADSEDVETYYTVKLIPVY